MGVEGDEISRLNLKGHFGLIINNIFLGGVISTPNVVISKSFGVEITNNSANFSCYLLFSHQMI